MSAFVLRIAFVIYLAAALSACTYGSAAAQGSPDALLADRVGAAIEAASDLPANAIVVEASNGVVTITGSVAGEECGVASPRPASARFNKASERSCAQSPVSSAWNSIWTTSYRKSAEAKLRGLRLPLVVNKRSRRPGY